MKTTLITILAFAAFTTLLSCGQKHEHEHDGTADSTGRTGNQALYEEVMKIHDEAMAKMDKIYTLKRDLKEKVKTGTAITAEQKAEFEVVIARLDSADKGMMDWMHKFEPIGDSEGEEKAREYLESEMEKVKKVREQINEALEEGAEKLKGN